ncbi:hypothetical protein [Kangiella shandongensis]|uniref:hypothetical protein n=1 Tax=Kangiella shandongensis TaxID=2763258 RepID=UPI001CBF3831|nr:hypothetical protein [Kangiella shandongensis]
MDPLFKRHRRNFGKNLFKNNWLALELIAVLCLICLLLVSFLQVIPQYFYKTSATEPLSQYPINARVRQQEHYAWHGAFDEKPPSASISKSTVGETVMLSGGSTTSITTKSYKQLPETSYQIELIPISGSLIMPQCTSTETEHRYLLPYICKLQNQHFYE